MFKKAVIMIVATMILAFVGGPAQAQTSVGDGLVTGGTEYINPGGLGDSLVYAYYNTKGSVNLFNIVNTSPTSGAKVRLVVRAGKNSEEILDFSICLSKNDLYTAAILDNGSGAASICGGIDTDTVTSATVPALPGCLPFRTVSGSTLTADDLKEGYVEILGLSPIPTYDKNATNTTACPASYDGTFRNCIRTAEACDTWHKQGSPVNGLVDLDNVLFGTSFFVAPDGGTYGYNATAVADTTLAAFLDPGVGSELALTDVADSGCAIEYTFGKSEIIAPFDVITGFVKSAVILNFPTRKACHEADLETDTGNNIGLTPRAIGNLFTCVISIGGKCVKYETPISARIFNDKENELKGPGCTVSPCPTADLFFVENEVNVLTFAGLSPFSTGLGKAVDTGTYQLGWAAMSLVNPLPAAAPGNNGPNAPQGLPAIGYMVQDLSGLAYMVPVEWKPLLP